MAIGNWQPATSGWQLTGNELEELLKRDYWFREEDRIQNRKQSGNKRLKF